MDVQTAGYNRQEAQRAEGRQVGIFSFSVVGRGLWEFFFPVCICALYATWGHLLTPYLFFKTPTHSTCPPVLTVIYVVI